MSDSEYQEVTNDVRVFPGPRLFWVSGYTHDEWTSLTAFLHSIGYSDVPVKYCTVEQLPETLQTVLHSPIQGIPPEAGKLPCTLVFSGLTSDEVKQVMTRFKESGQRRPIFATTTPTNLDFTVRTLLRHLVEEQRAAIGANSTA